MEKLIIEPTGNSPRIVLDPENKLFEFSGESRPENVRKFYLPILEWLESYTKEQEKLNGTERSRGLQCQFNFEYFNSTSAKYILDIFKSLNAISALGIDLDIKWLYEEDDEDMLEVGQEMSRMSKLSFEYIKSDA
jgi:alkyl hydroperoxide reductase subunit AhpF